MDDSRQRKMEAKRRKKERMAQYNETFQQIVIYEASASSSTMPTAEPSKQEPSEGELSMGGIFSEFQKIIDCGKRARALNIVGILLAMNDVEAELISPNLLQPERFPLEDVDLLVTNSCLELLREVVTPFLAPTEKKHTQGVVGPSGLGKSYALLYNYLLARNRHDAVIVYVNNPEDLLKDPIYFIKELIFSFATFLFSENMDGTFNESPVRDLNRDTSLAYLESLVSRSTLTDLDLLRVLWAFYVDSTEENELQMDLLVKIVKLLRRYCSKYGMKLYLFFDQFNVLYRRKGSNFSDEWQDIILGKKKCFSKILWVASQNNDFKRLDHEAYQLVSFLSTEELESALKEHIFSIDDEKTIDYFNSNFASIVIFLEEHTNGNALEVYYLLNTEGFEIQEKWERYFRLRRMALKKKFVDFCLEDFFKVDIFYALLPLVDFVGDIIPFIDDDNYTLGFDLKMLHQNSGCSIEIMPGSIDWNLAYFHKTKKILCSKSPVAHSVIRDILFFMESKRIHEICQKAYYDTCFSSGGLKGVFFETMVISNLTERCKNHFFNLAPIIKDEIQLQYARESKEFCFTLEVKKVASKEYLWSLLRNYTEKFEANKKKSGSKESIYQALMLIPLSSTFPLVDYFIFIPYFFKNVGRKKTKFIHILLSFQVTINVSTHIHEESGKLSDIALRDGLCKRFEKFFPKTEEFSVIKKQFVWVTDCSISDLGAIACEKDSWFAMSKDFNPVLIL